MLCLHCLFSVYYACTRRNGLFVKEKVCWWYWIVWYISLEEVTNKLFFLKMNNSNKSETSKLTNKHVCIYKKCFSPPSYTPAPDNYDSESKWFGEKTLASVEGYIVVSPSWIEKKYYQAPCQRSVCVGYNVLNSRTDKCVGGNPPRVTGVYCPASFPHPTHPRDHACRLPRDVFLHI